MNLFAASDLHIVFATFPTALNWSRSRFPVVGSTSSNCSISWPGTRDTFELQVWSSCTVQNDARKPIEWIWRDDGEWWWIHQLSPWRFLGFIPDMLDRYTVYTCKMHLRMRQTITVISRTLESLRISIIAFCSKSWVCLLHYNEIARSIAAGCSWKPVMQKVSTAGSRWEGWTAKFEAAPNGSLIAVQSCLALYSSKEDFKVD